MYGVIRRWCVVGTIVLYSLLTASQAADCENGAVSSGPCNSEGRCDGPYRCNSQNVCCPARLNTGPTCSGGAPSKGPCDSEGSCTGPYTCNDQNVCCPMRLNVAVCEDGRPSNGQCNSEGNCQGPYQCNGQNLCCPIRLDTAVLCEDGMPSNGQCDSEGNCQGPYQCNGQNLCCPARINSGSCDDGGISNGPCDSEGSCKGPFTCNSQNMCCPVRINTGSCDDGGISSGPCDSEGSCKGPFSCNSQNKCCPVRIHTGSCQNGAMSSGQCDVEGKCQGPYTCNSQNMCCPFRFNTDDCDEQMPSVGPCDTEGKCSGPYICNARNKCCPIKVNTGDCDDSMPSSGSCDSEQRCSGPYYCNGKNKCCPVKLNTGDCGPGMSRGLCDSEGRCSGPYYCSSSNKCCPVKVNKDMMCPPVTPGMMGTCVEECSTNSQCPKGTMCCSNGCGHTCQVPVSRMRGKCPSYNKDTVGICVGNGAGGKKCSGDMDCKNGDLCCNNGCGPVCTPADTKTPCQRELAMAMIQMRTSLDSCSPIFIPRCDRKGNYHRTQCYDNNGLCFCVNPNGTKIAGTEVRGNPDCSKATKPGTCPAIVSVSKSDLICSSTCQSDDDCIGSDKCCTNGCAYHCSPAVFKDDGLSGTRKKRHAGDDVCANGMTAAGPCDGEGACNGPYMCDSHKNLCCPIQINVVHTCSDGTSTMTSCDSEGGCPSGTTCEDKFCCPPKTTGAFCIYKPYIDTTVTYVGVVGSIKMASAEACKAACDKDTLADCIGVVYQKDKGGRCAKYTDQTHVTKTPLKGSVYYERLCQFSAGLCRNQSSVLMSDGVPKTCNHDNDCGVQSFGCEGGHCCPRLNRPPTIPPTVLCKSGGIVIKDTNGLVKSCSPSTPCGAGEECEDSVCCPKAILQGLCPGNGEVLMEDGSPKTCMTDQECGAVGYKCQGQLGSKYCCPGSSAQVVCPNGGIPQKMNNLPKSCTSDTQCGPSYTCKGNPGSKHCCPTKLYKLDVCPNNGMVFISDGRPKRCTVNADCLGGIGVYTCVDNYCCPQKVNQNMCPHNGRVLKINGHPRTCTADIECQGSRQGSFSCQQGYCCPRSNICPDGKEPKCCDIKLCLYHACPLAPRAACRINPCGGCKVEFYDRFNNIVNCTAGLTKCQEKQQKTVEVSMMWVDTTGYTSVQTDGLVQQISNEGLDDQDTTVVPKPLDSKPGQCPGGDLHDTGITSTSPCTTDSECAGDKKCCYNGNNTYCRLPVIVPMTKGHCEKPPVVGLCEGYFIRYFYNSTSRKCEQFVYGGCHGNENNFQTLEACQRGCIEGTPQECLESPDRGQCKAYIPMFFYNVNSGKCEKFIYGGCQGNSNKFTTLQQCYATCISSWNPSHPCARTRCPGNTKCVAKDDKQAECVPKGTLPNGAGVHMPDCMADGRYAPVQCQGALCWCVHNSGKMIPGSMTLGRPQCNIGGPLVGPTQPSTTVACPDGSLPQICDLCLTARCGGRPAVKCLADPCNNCAVKFVDRSGSAVNCGDKCNGVKPAVIQGISDLECGNRKKVWYYNKVTQTCQETFVCTNHASSPSVYASKLECQSECTASVCGGSGPMTCTTTCNNLSCKRFPSAVCRVNPCTCNTEFYDPVTNLQVNCDVVTPICQIQRAQMMLSVTPSKLKQDVTEYVCNVRGEFLPQQCDRAKHCWCVDGLGKMTSQKKITVRNIAQSIGCKENKTKSAVLSVTYNVDYDSVIKGKESSFKRAFMQRLQEITPEIRQYVQKIMLRRGSVIVDVVLITPDSDSEVKDVGAFVNLLSSEISKGLAVTFDGKLLVSETAVNSRLSFEQEPESQKAPVTDTEDRKTVLIVVLTVVLSAVLITAVIVICLVKRRGGKFSSLEEGKESPRMSNDMYFHNAACEKK